MPRMNKFGPRIWGSIAGFVLGFSLMLLGLKKFLLILLLTLVGYAVGRFLESEKMVARVRKMLFR